MPRATPLSGSPGSRREAALQAYLGGDYAGAERLLRSLVAERYEMPSTHCHLARIYLIQDRFAKAARHVEAAWKARDLAPSNIVPRILWLRLALIFIAPRLVVGANCAPVVLGRLKTAMESEGAHLGWSMSPVLDHFQGVLSDDRHELLSKIVAVLSRKADLSAINRIPAWRDASDEARFPDN